ncbi:MAG: arginine--tRNA ligase [Candidatus Dojkabacteria bacterium]|jgi:arginyl-tRNA synthetase
MIEIISKIENLIKQSLKKQGIKEVDIVVEIPNDDTHGDYSSNVAMILASKVKENPMDIAQRIVDGIQEDVDIDRVEIVQPGFINFFLSNRYLLTEASKIVDRKEEYFKLDSKEGQRVLIEYTDANLFKEMHIGHLYSNVIGESFARLQEALGADVKRSCYQGDVGLHVAKTLWGLEKKLEEDQLSFERLETFGLDERVKYLGEAYSLGEEYYTEIGDSVAVEEIDNMNYYIFSLVMDSLEKRDSQKYEEIHLSEKYKKGRQWCLDFFEKIYEKVGTEFDYYFFESEVCELGLKIVLDNIGKVFEKDEGSIIYRGDEKKNLHTRVFVNKYGLPVYEAKELALVFKKAESIDFDESIIVTADEQSGYFKVVFDALSKIDRSLAEKIRHIAHGKVKLPGNKKMSSRKGNILSADWLIEETKKRVLTIMESSSEFDVDNLDPIAEKIAVGAIKYAFLKIGVGRDIVFDFDKSITFDGNTGPYLMYVYSRCNSILLEGNSVNSKTLCLDMCLNNTYVKRLISHVSKYKYSLLNSSSTYSPSVLCQYLFELGKYFNTFYQNVRVLDAEDEEKQILLLLVNATMNVMEDGLNNLGIPIVERM